MIRRPWLCSLLLLASAACSNPTPEDPKPGLGGEVAEEQPSDASTGKRPDAATSKPDAGSLASSKDAATSLEIRLDIQVRIGSFLVTLGAAKLQPSTSTMAGRVVIDFEAKSTSTALLTPLEGMNRDDLVLTLGSTDLLGAANVDEVLGQKSGAGTLSWKLEDDAAAALAFPNAQLTFGDAASNQIVVRFADPAATDGLADITSPTAFKLDAYNRTNIVLKSAWVTYQDFKNQRLLPAGTAQFNLDLTLTAVADIGIYSAFWNTGNIVLNRPDGATVSAPINESVSASGPKQVRLSFDVERPVSGSYVVTFKPEQMEPKTQTIVIP